MVLNWEKASAPRLPDLAIILDRFSSQRAFCRPDPRAAACILLLSWPRKRNEYRFLHNFEKTTLHNLTRKKRSRAQPMSLSERAMLKDYCRQDARYH
jgi:hypothetical protein